MDRKDFQKKLSETPFEPLWRVVYQYLQDEIMVFRLPPNCKINEISIADALGIGRSPVRMAIQKLIQEGLIEKAPGKKSVQIAQISAEECNHLCEARTAIEGRAAYLAAKQINEAQLARMRDCLTAFETVGAIHKAASFAEIDDQFHCILVEASCNPFLIAMYHNIRKQLLRYRYYAYSIYTSDTRTLARCHHAIYNALNACMSEEAKAEAEFDANQMVGVIANKVIMMESS